jgi:hypothetical protein
MPNMACKVIDWLRLADRPDEVHRNQIGRLELKRHRLAQGANRTAG